MSPIVRLDHVQVAAPPGGEDDARRFYGKLLGLPEVPKPQHLQTRGGVWFAAGDQQLHVGVDEDFTPARKAHPALAVGPGELEPLAARLVEAGVDLHWGDERRFHTQDPWGNRLEVLEA